MSAEAWWSLSVPPFDDGLAAERLDRLDLTDRIAHLTVGARHPDRGVAFQVVGQKHVLADVVHHHLAALAIGHRPASLRIDHRKSAVGTLGVVNDRVVLRQPLTDLLATQYHRASVDVAHFRIRKDFSQYPTGIL